MTVVLSFPQEFTSKALFEFVSRMIWTVLTLLAMSAAATSCAIKFTAREFAFA